MIATPLWIPLLLGLPARAACDPAELAAALDAAEQAFRALDAKGVGRAVDTIEDTLGCVREPVTAAVCARVHRARALDAFLSGDRAALALHLRAMLHADPLGELPSDLVPPGHVVRLALVEAEEATLELAEAPGGGWPLVDGLRTGVVPVGQPYVLQRTNLDGTTDGARLVEASSGASRGGGGSPRGAVRWAGIGLGVVAAGLYGAAWAERAAYASAVAAQDDPRIGRTHAATNALSVGSVAAAGLGSALIVGSITLR